MSGSGIGSGQGLWLAFRDGPGDGIPSGELPTVGFQAVGSTAAEGGKVLVAVELSAPHVVPIVVTIQDVTPAGSGFATGGVDYVVEGTPLTIPAGATMATFNIQVQDDLETEGEELGTLRITAASETMGAMRDVEVRAAARDFDLTILASDLPTSTLSWAQTTFAVEEGQTLEGAVLRLSEAAGDDVVVTLAVAGGSATIGQDFSVPLQVTIPAGETEVGLALSAATDNTPEAVEDVVLEITAVTNALMPTQTQASVFIGDNTAEVAWNVGFTTVSEGGMAMALFVRQDRAIGVDQVVTLAQIAGDAVRDKDWVGPLEVTIPAGQTEVQYSFGAIQDATLEGQETASLQIQAVSAGSIGGLDTCVVTIADIQSQVSFTNTAETIAEGQTTSTLAISRDIVTQDDVVVTLERADGTAVADVDYTAPLQVTIPKGQASVPFPVTALTDAVSDDGETVTFRIIGATNAVVGAPSEAVVTLNDLPSSIELFWSTNFAEVADGGTLNLAANISAPLGSNLVVTLTKAGGQGTVTFPATVTILAGQTSAAVQITKAAPASLAGCQALWLDLSAVGVTTDENARLTVETNDVQALEQPVIGMIVAKRWAVPDAGLSSPDAFVEVEVEVLNRDVADLTAPIDLEFRLEASGPGDLGVDLTLTQLAQIPAGDWKVRTTVGLQTHVGGDVEVFNPSRGSIEPTRAVCEVRGPGAGRTAEMNGQRIRGFVGDTLMHAVVPLNPAPINVPQFKMAVGGGTAVDADVHAVTYDVEDGNRTALVHMVAPLSGTGDSNPGTADANLITVTEANDGTIPSMPLLECDLSDLIVQVSPAGIGGLRMEAKPFDQAHVSHLRTTVKRDGRWWRRTEVLSEFRKQLSTGASTRENSLWLLLTIRETRCDMKAENLTFVLLNGKWDPTESAWSISQVGCGPTYFDFAVVGGFDAGGTQEAVLLQDRPGDFYKANATTILLSDNVGTTGVDLQYISSGGQFARRICVYESATVTQATAEDVVARRDYGELVGQLGYENGGYEGWCRLPNWNEVGTIATGQTDVWAEVRAYGAEMETDIRNAVETGGMEGETQGRNGWMHVIDQRRPGGSGEAFITLLGGVMQSPGQNVALMLTADSFLERMHMALYNVRDLRPANLADVVEAHDGKLPMCFSGIDRNRDQLHPHMRDPNPFTGERKVDEEFGGELAPDDLPWNELPADKNAPFLSVTAAQHGSGSANWGPNNMTHSSRSLSAMMAGLYRLDDPVCELGVLEMGLTAALAWSHLEVDPARPVRRFAFGEPQSNLHHVRENLLGEYNEGRGFWTDYVSFGQPAGFGQSTPRGPFHAWAAVMGRYSLLTPSERTMLDGDGNDDESWFAYVADIVDHTVGGMGLWIAGGGRTDDRAYYDRPIDWVERSGTVPNDGPSGVPEWWTVQQLYHFAYGGWALVPMSRRLQRDADRHALLDRSLRIIDIWCEAVAEFAGDTLTVFNERTFGLTGSRSFSNPPMTEQQARKIGYWAGEEPIVSSGAKPWSGLCMVAAHYERFQRTAETLDGVKRQWAAPSSVNLDQTLANFANYVKGWLEDNSHGPGSYQMQSVPALQVLIAEGAVKS